MAKLIYMSITSLDGYVEDAQGSFDWAEPDEAVHAFVNDLARPVGTYLYRMYCPTRGNPPDFAPNRPGTMEQAPLRRGT